MTHPNADTALDTLEKFNHPENFLATRKSFDVATFRKNTGYGAYVDYRFVREDGVHVWQRDYSDKGYQEELTRPDSHYEYGYAYDKKGRLKGMGTRFCTYGVGEGFWFDEQGNIIKRQNFDAPYLPIPTLRERFMEQTQTDKNDKTTGIDIYNNEMVPLVFHAENAEDNVFYYDIYVRKAPGSNDLTDYLLDGATGKLMFKGDAFGGNGIGPSAYEKYAEYLKSIGKTHVEYLQILLLKENADKAQ